jgi:4-carboxymuconolactone decarboxylase
MDIERFNKGLRNFQLLSGENKDLFEPLGDLGRYIIEYGFGDIYGRDGLSWRDRQISTMSIQIVQGYLPQFKIHAMISLHIGITKEEIEELIIHTTAYAGFPVAMNAQKAFQEVWQIYAEKVKGYNEDGVTENQKDKP